jgi:hypothetical protein
VVGLPEVQSVGEYEARYGAYRTQRHQPPAPQQSEEKSADSSSPRIFRAEPKKSTSTRQQTLASKVRKQNN